MGPVRQKRRSSRDRAALLGAALLIGAVSAFALLDLRGISFARLLNGTIFFHHDYFVTISSNVGVGPSKYIAVPSFSPELVVLTVKYIQPEFRRNNDDFWGNYRLFWTDESGEVFWLRQPRQIFLFYVRKVPAGHLLVAIISMDNQVFSRGTPSILPNNFYLNAVLFTVRRASLRYSWSRENEGSLNFEQLPRLHRRKPGDRQTVYSRNNVTSTVMPRSSPGLSVTHIATHKSPLILGVACLFQQSLNLLGQIVSIHVTSLTLEENVSRVSRRRASLMYCGPRRPRPAHHSRSAVDHEYEELLEEETAEPKESSKEPNYHAYHALFSHFPDPDFLPRRTGENRVCAFP